MDFILNKILNVLLPLIGLITILIFLPPNLIFKLFKYFKGKFSATEKLIGKVVLITGASSGIGEALAYEYAMRGANLALAARRVDRLKEVAANAAEMGSGDVFVICADVSKVDDCKRLVEETVNHFGILDTLVNNAGILRLGFFEDYTELSDLRSIMEINFWGSVYCTQFAIPHLKKSKGNIIVVSSSANWLATPRLSIYNASKAAQLLFFESLKAEFGNDIGITIATPGLIGTEMIDDQFLSKTKSKGLPVESAESCARAIVENACRGEMYLTVPRWYIVIFWFKVVFPESVHKTKSKGFPVESAERCARVIVENACRGEMYLTGPLWYIVVFWFKVVFPESVHKVSHLMMVKTPLTNSNKHA